MFWCKIQILRGLIVNKCFRDMSFSHKQFPKNIVISPFFLSQSGTIGQKILKSPGQKFVKSNKSISRKIFGQIAFFAISKIAKDQFLNFKKVPN